MSNVPPPNELSEALQRLAGYLNFSSGSEDPAILSAWNSIFTEATQGEPLAQPTGWLVLKDWLLTTIEQLRETQSAFRDTAQAEKVIRLLWSEFLPSYLDFHRDLLFHQEPEILFNGFFLGHAAEAILAAGLERDDAEIVQEAINRLNDFVGYRPVAILENRRCDAYPHEFIRPIPLFIRGAGVSSGPYCELITRAIETLAETDPNICESASFELSRMAELSLDPRAYDFDHPVNRRPNYHFGGWDERAIGMDGYFYRFTLRQVTLDALLSRLNEADDIDRAELLDEAATVLAGTMLMASGITGWGPGAITSDVTLGSLMKPIARYRDAFYEDRLSRIDGGHAKRLHEEQTIRQQPFGAARQHLNAALAQRRAAQLQHVALARLYARMGYPDAATRQTDTVPAASARMMCRIDCAMTSGMRSLRSGKLEVAAKVPRDAFGLIRRGIDCGALIDPWNILGFGGNFNLYPGPESGIHDSRVDDILYLLEQLFGYMAKVWSEAAAEDNESVFTEMDICYREVATWWREYAAHTVDSIEASDPMESYESAKLVAQALRLWHRGGASSGDVAFWAPHANLFDSPRAYALVVSALLDRRDFLPARALIIHWLGNAENIGLRQAGNSLPRLAERWLLRLRDSGETSEEANQLDLEPSQIGDTSEIWPLARTFFDYLEANAEEFWSAPDFLLGSQKKNPDRDWDLELTAADEDESLYDAAYEGVTYKDTTDDGVDGAVFEFGQDVSVEELEAESKRLIDRLSLLKSLARMWAVAADIAVAEDNPEQAEDRLNSLRHWANRAKENRVGLLELLDAVRNYEIKPAGSDKESMRNYDRSRVLRDSLMERIIGTSVEMSDSRRLVCGALLAFKSFGHELPPEVICDIDELDSDDAHAVQMYGALISGDADSARKLFSTFLGELRNKNLLYIPLSRGGAPVKIHLARLRQRVLRHLMHWLPRRGLIVEACALVETARQMEQQNSVGIGAVTEFDGLFRTGFRSLVRSMVESVRSSRNGASQQQTAEELIPVMELLTEALLYSWLSHSQTLRLSPLESVSDKKKWEKMVDFVKRYGDPIFTQMYLQLGNVRAILHQGVANWLERAVEQGDENLRDTQLFQDLESGELEIKTAEKYLTLVYETLIDHHAEYLDYNSTTTQSDRGDLVYMFMDFLRLQSHYERIAWNLKPVMWAHEVLVRSGLETTAAMWRRSLNERIGKEADVYVQRLRKLQKNYSMRMPTVADRIQERFVQPMTIDRIRALVGPAMRDAEAGRESAKFDLLEKEAEIMTRSPTGVGLDVPAWLDALEEEVEQLAKKRASSEINPQALMTISIMSLTLDEFSQQLTVARSQGRRLPHSPSE